MRAYRLPKTEGIDALTLVEEAVPKPAHRQILVKVVATSLNFRDLALIAGSYRGAIAPNVVPLSDGAGEVVEVGPGVQRFKVGDRVAGCFFQRWFGGGIDANSAGSALGGPIDGMLREYAVLEEEGAVLMPAHLSYEEAATLPCAAVTAWHAMVEHARLKAGQCILVQGTGGVSIFALQFARMMGVRVIATSSSNDKLARAKALGASDGINYRTHEAWDEAALACTDGRGVDQVVEVGGADTFSRSLKAIRSGGSISLIGVLTRKAEINPMAILAKRANVQGISVGSTQMFEAMNAAIAVNGLKPVIDKVFGFEEAKAAFTYLQSAAHFGKVVIRVG
ncbi:MULTISPECIES: NAD(P)-dependent alcohol dehydrogenase [unclassified Beijerinckia]|uniref:zinc-dependent alcohol dehydrogenase family protein n=1 Tax=unclassified Beijerinckia TaxID=2638183 RepID=UPI000897C1D6|nr:MULTISPECIES: NAD(P)-dependent alcohol dehydrogenase [unclassified Beijerinckia]MDH7795487.1 NADPH:quinone reductase-like Zn-dependent oxidoreductase [Beijerinckia sp. GAS462]SEC03597.1 NADPH:quinone reductase [Beijerinckia sp. 28-YEA-48]